MYLFSIEAPKISFIRSVMAFDATNGRKTSFSPKFHLESLSNTAFFKKTICFLYSHTRCSTRHEFASTQFKLTYLEQ